MEPSAGDITALSGCPPTYAHAAKIIWWKNHGPEVFNSTAKFIVPLAYVAGKMAGLEVDQAYIDYTCIHFSGFADTRNLKWSRELLDRFGIPEEKLPRIIAPTEIIGRVTREAAQLTGLKEGTPIAAGAETRRRLPWEWGRWIPGMYSTAPEPLPYFPFVSTPSNPTWRTRWLWPPAG